MVLFSIIMNSDDAFAASFASSDSFTNEGKYYQYEKFSVRNVTPLSTSLSESLAHNLNTLKTCFILRTVKNRLLKYHLKYAVNSDILINHYSFAVHGNSVGIH